jgi:hypothetical protein
MSSIANSPDPEYYFSEQIMLYPIVASTLKNMSLIYLKIKHINSASKLVFGIVENWMARIVTLYMIIFNKYQSQFKFIDSALGRVLQCFETYAPEILARVYALIVWSYELSLKVVKLVLDVLAKPFKYLKFVYDTNKLIWMCIFNKLVDLLELTIEKNLITQKVTLEPLEKHVELFKTHKKRSSSEKEYCKSIEKSVVLVMVIIHWLRIKFVEQMDAWKVTDLVCGNFVYKLIESCVTGKNLSAKLQEKINNRFFLTKEKIDLYKEYLDVLTKQFTVQDGRSLENVHVYFF